MDTIGALERDVFSQVESLSGFLPRPVLGSGRKRRAVFCGSGDSLAACMLAEAFSGYDVRAADPLDLLKNKSVMDGRDAYIVSISGRTISNIRVARLARRSVAITSSMDSRLARACTETIRLQFPNSDVVTAGSASFLESALTCISLVCDTRVRHAGRIFRAAEEIARDTRLRGRVFFLGNMHTYPVAMYAAAKIYEVLGAEAYYERLEQFSHMELFSAKRGDAAVIFEEKTRHNVRLAGQLEAAGLEVVRMEPPYRDRVSQFLFFTFLSQMVPLFAAKRRRQKECHFVTAKALRSASDRMIY